MNSPTRLKDLAELTSEALARQNLLDRGLERRRGDNPRLGDLFAAPESAQQPVQWVSLQRDPKDPGHVLIVPADPVPLIGSRDLEVREATTGTPLGLRCGHGVWIDAGRLDPALRTGEMTADDVVAALRKCDELATGRASPSVLDEEVDGDPEYVEWIEKHVKPAAAAWTTAWQPAGLRRPVPRSWRPYLLATAALLLLSLGLNGVLLHTRSTPDPEAIRDLPLTFLSAPEILRGSPTILRVAAGAPRFAVVLQLDPSKPLFDRYRLEVESTSTGQPHWAGGGLVRRHATRLSLELPRKRFPDGEYRFRLYGHGSEAPPVAEYRLGIRSEALPYRQSP